MRARRHPGVPAFLGGSALLAGLCIAWTNYGQRSLLAIGDLCSSGRGFRSDTPCPDGMLLVGLGLPVMFAVVLAASAMAVLRELPAPLVPTWAVLFTCLSANCLDFGLDPPRSTSSLVWAAVFALLAVPGWWGLGRSVRSRPGDKRKHAAARINWISAYIALGAVGWVLGWLTFGPLS